MFPLPHYRYYFCNFDCEQKLHSLPFLRIYNNYLNWVLVTVPRAQTQKELLGASSDGEGGYQIIIQKASVGKLF
jgi:hypothetical protein